jgi:8-oxo-dGTP pyrophosphatase MutT (NUDIX family)
MARFHIPSADNGKSPIREDRKVPSRIEVHVAGVCLRARHNHWEVLIAKRTNGRQIHPGKWECGGGQVRRGESFPDAIKRQIFEEFGLEVEINELLETYEIHIPGQRVIPGVRFLCVSEQSRIRLNKREFSSYRWVKFPVPTELDWIEGVKRILDVVGAQLIKIPVERKPPDTQRGPLFLSSRAIN